MAQHLLETVRKGYLSDPPDISLYHLMGKDRDGLNLYRTTRGTNSLEGGFHKNASPELAECLLLNWISRHNTKVGFYNCSGKKYQGHFDKCTRDEIVELAVAVNSTASFPLPRVLSTRIATSETIGILPISTSLAADLNITTIPRKPVTGVPHHRDIPVHTMTRLSTKPTNQYHYLQLRQRTLAAVLPVHTHQEYMTFKRHINQHDFRKGAKEYPPHEQWKAVDFDKFAKFWNQLVGSQSRAITESNQRLYYRLPLQLEAHHKKTLLWNSECSTLADGVNFASRKPLLDILNSDENYVDVLPAIPLSDGEIDTSITGPELDPNSFNPMATLPASGDHGLEEMLGLDDMLSLQDMISNSPPIITSAAPPIHPAVHQTFLPGPLPVAIGPKKTPDRTRSAFGLHRYRGSVFPALAASTERPISTQPRASRTCDKAQGSFVVKQPLLGKQQLLDKQPKGKIMGMMYKHIEHRVSAESTPTAVTQGCRLALVATRPRVYVDWVQNLTPKEERETSGISGRGRKSGASGRRPEVLLSAVLATPQLGRVPEGVQSDPEEASRSEQTPLEPNANVTDFVEAIHIPDGTRVTGSVPEGGRGNRD
ncbi:hypothetical protein DFH07DRAFT_941871 [Mycena maculata]|uniref:Uncharacterized protein n=1 Tax=Mycena maculata TaxID=230809 RepID=A0AAD7IVY6_9AGAR|nr:hypothetical protein DFH07DRAFT_941871 [Mycena maculata]